MRISRLLFAGYMILTLQACLQPAVPVQQAAPPVKIIPQKIVITTVRHDTLCITAVGDIMLGTSYPVNNTLPPDSGKNSFKAIQQYLQNTDVAFGNLEGTLLDSGAPAHYKLHFKSTAYLFRMPRRCGMVLKDAGFNTLSIANNHIGDFGDKGRLSTTKTLDSCGINYAGLLSHATTIFEINGIKYGFCAFAPNAQTVSILDLKNAAQLITQLKQQCNVVIVAFHGGCEGPAYEHITFKDESYIGERRGNVHAFAHNAIDAGADIVLGTGPHVSRAMEVYKSRFIAYSLGNFCTYKCISVAGVCGIAPILKVYVNKKGEFLNGRIIAVKQTHENGLQPDSLNLAIKRIKLLTETDFPLGELRIGDDGVITKAIDTVAVN
jgi:poly-gamma-glutamate capsule biosynthesis protein CapA/YwtB (metallophosphatase superfamily)